MSEQWTADQVFIMSRWNMRGIAFAHGVDGLQFPDETVIDHALAEEIVGEDAPVKPWRDGVVAIDPTAWPRTN